MLLVMIVRLCLCLQLACLHCVGAAVCAVGCSFLPFVVADACVYLGAVFIFVFIFILVNNMFVLIIRLNI